jgi:hypothetical protein
MPGILEEIWAIAFSMPFCILNGEEVRSNTPCTTMGEKHWRISLQQIGGGKAPVWCIPDCIIGWKN